MSLELKQHYVAFLDILGFTEMVISDTGSSDQEFLSKLFRCHQSASQIIQHDPDCSITQFSDSIVISKPYEANSLAGFTKIVAEYQRLLLDEELLCRGGIAVDRHFSNGSFTFSAALIAAYKVESRTSRYPRVVISPEVIDLIYPTMKKQPSFLIKEDDGLFFVDYLGLTLNKRPVKLDKAIKNIVSNLLNNKNSSIREKGLWLAMYSDAIRGTTLGLPKFSGGGIKSLAK